MNYLEAYNQFLDAHYDETTGKGYGDRNCAVVFLHAMSLGDYAVVKSLTCGQGQMILRITCKRHLAALEKIACFSAPTKRSKPAILRLLRSF